jgi:hypothetical protein
MSGDHDAASSSLLFLVNTIFDSEASCLDGIVQDGGVLVIPNTT